MISMRYKFILKNVQQLTNSLCLTSTNRRTTRQISYHSQQLVDRNRIIVSGGNGGDGCSSFARGPNQNIAPPDGGNGGSGGCVILQGTGNCRSLRMTKKILNAEHGTKGMTAKRRGRRGNDLIVQVPLGTIVREIIEESDEDCLYEKTKEENKILLCELNNEGQQVIVAQGGTGGRGNMTFKSSRNRSPLNFDKGENGETRRLELEMKLIADIGLVGFPNAGKSTFLKAISAAKPKIAAYPFTTVRPNVGVLSCCEEKDDIIITVADIPGLIRGAHENRGLGHEFLKHIERTSVLAYVIDISEEAITKFEILKQELEYYNPGLSERAVCIVANKMDIGPNGMENLEKLIRKVGNKMIVMPISAKIGTGVDQVVNMLKKTVEERKSESTNKKDSTFGST